MQETPLVFAGQSADLGPSIRAFIERHLAVPENNNLGSTLHAQAWDGFLLGFSSGADEMYSFLKHHIGEFHWSPAEAFALRPAGDAAPAPLKAALSVPAEELSVISCALIQTETTKASNRVQTRWPSEPWARARIYGQRCVVRLQRALVAALEAGGYEAVAPALLPSCTEMRSQQFGEAYPWSERHVAHISGLGTFGLSGGLITERGQAHRLASVVVRAKLEPTPRPYDDPFAYCLHFSTGGCAECAARCPGGSVSTNGRDKQACVRHLAPGTVDYVKENYGFEGYGCGLCQTAVPCESRIPPRSAG